MLESKADTEKIESRQQTQYPLWIKIKLSHYININSHEIAQLRLLFSSKKFILEFVAFIKKPDYDSVDDPCIIDVVFG